MDGRVGERGGAQLHLSLKAISAEELGALVEAATGHRACRDDDDSDGGHHQHGSGSNGSSCSSRRSSGEGDVGVGGRGGGERGRCGSAANGGGGGGGKQGRRGKGCEVRDADKQSGSGAARKSQQGATRGGEPVRKVAQQQQQQQGKGNCHLRAVSPGAVLSKVVRAHVPCTSGSDTRTAASHGGVNGSTPAAHQTHHLHAPACCLRSLSIEQSQELDAAGEWLLGFCPRAPLGLHLCVNVHEDKRAPAASRRVLFAQSLHRAHQIMGKFARPVCQGGCSALSSSLPLPGFFSCRHLVCVYPERRSKCATMCLHVPVQMWPTHWHACPLCALSR